MDLIQLIEKAKSASCYAGEKILRIYESNSFSGEIKYNKNNSPFTYADKISHLSIISVLEKKVYQLFLKKIIIIYLRIEKILNIIGL